MTALGFEFHLTTLLLPHVDSCPIMWNGFVSQPPPGPMVSVVATKLPTGSSSLSAVMSARARNTNTTSECQGSRAARRRGGERRLTARTWPCLDHCCPFTVVDAPTCCPRPIHRRRVVDSGANVAQEQHKPSLGRQPQMLARTREAADSVASVAGETTWPRRQVAGGRAHRIE